MLHSDTVCFSATANTPYDLHTRNHSYILWIVTNRR